MEKSLKNYVLVIMLVHIFLRNLVFCQDKKKSTDLFRKCAGAIFIIRQPVHFYTKNDTAV